MWIVYSLLAAVSFTVLFLIFKELEVRGVPTFVSLTWVFGLGCLWNIAHNVVTRQPLAVSASLVSVFAATALIRYVGNGLQFRATAMAPNPGYAVAIVSINAALISIASVWIFGAELSMMKIGGIGLCFLGVALLAIG